MVGYSADDYLRFSADKETIYYSEPVYACGDAYVLPTNVYFVKLRWTCSALNLDTVGVQLEHRRRLVPCFVVCLVYFMRECLFR